MKQKNSGLEMHNYIYKQNKRRLQIEQKFTSMRFHEQLRRITSQQCEFGSQFYSKIDEEELVEMVLEQRIDELYRMVKCCDFESMKMVQKYSRQLIEVLLKSISRPKGIICLTNLIKKSQLASIILYEMKQFDKIINCLRNNCANSYEQNVYLLCVSQILQLKQPYIQTVQLGHLLNLMEVIFKQRLESDHQDSLVITVIKILIEEYSSQHMNLSFLSAIISYFWLAKKMANIANLYIAAIVMIEKQIYHKSLTTLLNLIQIIIRGRNRIETDLQNKITPVLQILTTLFINYNSNWEVMDAFGQVDIEGQGNATKIGLHQFLLKFQRQIFLHSKIDWPFCLFLKEFVKNGSGGEIMLVLKQNGMLQYLIEQMASEPAICQLILKTLFVMMLKDSDIMTKEAIIEIMRFYEIEKSIRRSLDSFAENHQVEHVGNSLLQLLVITIK